MKVESSNGRDIAIRFKRLFFWISHIYVYVYVCVYMYICHNITYIWYWYARIYLTRENVILRIILLKQLKKDPNKTWKIIVCQQKPFFWGQILNFHVTLDLRLTRFTFCQHHRCLHNEVIVFLPDPWLYFLLNNLHKLGNMLLRYPTQWQCCS